MQESHYYVWAEKVGVGKMISNLYIARMAAPNRLETVQVLVKDYDFSISDALRPLTSSVAGFLNLTGKGEILPGNDADLLVMTPELRIEQVYARGKLMVKDGKACVKGTFETA